MLLPWRHILRPDQQRHNTHRQSRRNYPPRHELPYGSSLSVGSNPRHHPPFQSLTRPGGRILPQNSIQQLIEILHRRTSIPANLFFNSARARITRVRTVPSGIPITAATSRDVISSIALSTSGCRNSSGKPSISRLSKTRSA